MHNDNKAFQTVEYKCRWMIKINGGKQNSGACIYHSDLKIVLSKDRESCPVTYIRRKRWHSHWRLLTSHNVIMVGLIVIKNQLQGLFKVTCPSVVVVGIVTV